jgi:hypothetical protein
MCNAINYNVIFFNEINFNVMTMTFIYYLITMKHLFYVILLLYKEVVLLCCVWCCDFKYLQDEYIRNTNIIWQHKLFLTNGNTDDPRKYKQTHRWIKVVGIFLRALELFPSQLHCSLYSVHARLPTTNIYWYFPES